MVSGVALALLPYYLSRLIVIPLSAFIIYRDRQDLIFKFEAFSSLIRLTYLCPLFMELDYIEFLLVYSVSNCVAYSVLCGTAISLVSERSITDASSR
jgi:O-antigen/teichoic acid export membrane protein